MNIAFIHPSAPHSEGSGATHSATEIIQALTINGHDVTVYCIGEVHPTAKRKEYDVKSLELGDGMLSNFPEEINNEINNRQAELGSFDIVHSYLMRSIPAMGKLGKNTAAKPIVTLNAYGGVCPRNDLLYMSEEICTSSGLVKCTKCGIQESMSTSLLEEKGLIQTVIRSSYRIQNRIRYYRKMVEGKSVLENIAQFHTLSSPVKQHYVKFGFPKNKITVIPNMMDDNFIINHKSDFTEPFKLLHVGRIKYRKGVDRLINVVEKFREQYDCNIHLTIAGDGQMLPTIQMMIDEKNMGDIVTVLGHVDYDDLPKLYADHDLFIYLGRWDEPFGRVFLESLGAGTPVFATDVGNISKIVEEAGYISQGSSDFEIANDLKNALDTNELRKKSERTEQALNSYHADRIYEEFQSFYESV